MRGKEAAGEKERWCPCVTVRSEPHWSSGGCGEIVAQKEPDDIDDTGWEIWRADVDKKEGARPLTYQQHK